MVSLNYSKEKDASFLDKKLGVLNFLIGYRFDVVVRSGLLYLGLGV